MKILIRVDGNSKVGIGHLTRSFALAHGLQKAGHTVLVVGNFTKKLEKVLKVSKIKTSYFKTSLSWKEDVKRMIQISSQMRADWIITDGYQFSSRYQKALRKQSQACLFCIDDIAKTTFCSELLLNQNSNASRDMYRNKISRLTKLLLGPSYALLRPAFWSPNGKHPLREVKNILVTMGGADFKNQTGKVLKALENLPTDFTIHVVIGPSNHNKSEIKQWLKKSNRMTRLILSPQASEMKQLMDKCDIAISASGSTSWELCCEGIPSVLMVLSSNQAGVARSLGELGAAINLGEASRVSEKIIRSAVWKLITNSRLRQKIGNKSKALVDGGGVKRVVAMMEKGVLCRK